VGKRVRRCRTRFPTNGFFYFNTFAIFLKPLILRALCTRKIKGFRKMVSMLLFKTFLRKNIPRHSREGRNL